MRIGMLTSPFNSNQTVLESVVCIQVEFPRWHSQYQYHTIFRYHILFTNYKNEYLRICDALHYSRAKYCDFDYLESDDTCCDKLSKIGERDLPWIIALLLCICASISILGEQQCIILAPKWLKSIGECKNKMSTHDINIMATHIWVTMGSDGG